MRGPRNTQMAFAALARGKKNKKHTVPGCKESLLWLACTSPKVILTSLKKKFTSSII